MPSKKDSKIQNFMEMMKIRQLTKEESADFIKLTMALHQHPEIEKPLDQDEKMMSQLPAKILASRIESYNLPFSMSNLFLGMSLITFVDRPGIAMILLRLMYDHHKKHGTKFFDIGIWGTEMFPMGVPTEESLNEMWDSQKCDLSPDNLLDYPENWE